MADEPNYYAVLGVSPNSEDVVIQAAYRALMRRYHPDKNPSAEAARKTIEINAAYAVLGHSRARAAYDEGRRAQAQQKQSESKARAERNSSAPPPPKQPPNSSKAATSRLDDRERPQWAKAFAVLLVTLLILGWIGLASGGAQPSASDAMNVDENLVTTDMNAVDMNATDMNAIDMNATDLNAVETELTPPDLSKIPQTPVSYSTIETAADRFVKILTANGIAGARGYSESCHKSVQAKPSWDAADSCAAYDYAAAYIDDAVSTQGGWPKEGYFQFESSNQSDAYASIGAPTYVTDARLRKIREAAQDAALNAFKAHLARTSDDRTTSPTASATSGNLSN